MLSLQYKLCTITGNYYDAIKQMTACIPLTYQFQLFAHGWEYNFKQGLLSNAQKLLSVGSPVINLTNIWNVVHRNI
jgi:hypothetical protein